MKAKQQASEPFNKRPEQKRTEPWKTRGKGRGHSRSHRSACRGTRSRGEAWRAPPRPQPPTPPRSGGPPPRALHRRSSPLTLGIVVSCSTRGRDSSVEAPGDRYALIWLWCSSARGSLFGGYASRREGKESERGEPRTGASDLGCSRTRKRLFHVCRYKRS